MGQPAGGPCAFREQTLLRGGLNMPTLKECGAVALGAFLVATPATPAALAGEVWMTNMQSANVQVFDADTLELLATIPAAKGAHNVTFSPDGSTAFVANVDTNSVTII